MPRLLIAGCGYLGQAVADLFCVRGWEVEGWTATEQSADELSGRRYRMKTVDISDAAQVADALGTFDAVVQCASSRGGDAAAYRRIYLHGARNLLAIFPAAAFVFTSSTSVYAQVDGAWVNEESPAEPAHETGRVLRQAESLVLTAAGVVARLGAIYGPGRSFLVRKFLRSAEPPDASSARYVNQIHRDDAADALRALVERNLAAKRAEIYNVVDDAPSTERECYEWLAAQIAPGAAEPLETRSRKRGDSNKRVANAKLRAAGWAPRYPTFREGIRDSVLPARERLGV